jgi:transposase InsO family protein
LIEPGSPTQNAYIESFNGTFRDERLDENWFESLAQTHNTHPSIKMAIFGLLEVWLVRLEVAPVV